MTVFSENRSTTWGAETMTTLRTFRILRLTRFVSLLCVAAWLAAPALASAPPEPGYDGYGSSYAADSLDPQSGGYEASYSYVRTLDGSATLIQGDTGERQQIEGKQPVLAGDRIWVAPSGRVEVVLSDRNLLRVDGGSEVVFDALAASPDRGDTSTVLRLAQGNVQLVVVDDFLGQELPRIDTGNATVYPRGPGSYRITAGGEDWTEVVARDGSADVVTHEGSIVVTRGQEAVLEGAYPTRSDVRWASAEDALELWGRRLDQEARYAENPYVDDSLRYEAASLDRYGSWVQVEGSYGWRPRVAVDWRPYWDGRWDFSPLGLTWVSYEPWGWVPYHYGSWDYVSSYGWVWFPGRRFGPAWVYWYWTDDYAGWVPVGYYSRYYRHYLGASFGFRFGIYGWAGGGWNDYDDWLFCPRGYLGYRHQNRYAEPGRRFGRSDRYAVPRRGLVTTDTRGVTRAELRKRDSIVDVLTARRRDGSRQLPDVTSFVARKPDLPQDVRRTIVIDRRDAAGRDRKATISVDRARPTGTAASSRSAVERTVPRSPEAVRPNADGPRRIEAGRSQAPVARDDTWRTEGVRGRAPATRPAARGDRPAPAAPSRTPNRDEVRPRAVPDRPARTDSPSRSAPARPRTSPDRPPAIDSAAGPDAGRSWRDRRPFVDGSAYPRAGAGHTDRGAQGPGELRSIPRRVIDGVRANGYSRVPVGPTRRPTSGAASAPSSSRPRIEAGRGIPSRSAPTVRGSSSPPPSQRSRSSASPAPRRSSPPPASRARSSSSHGSSRSSASRSRGSSGGRSRGSSSHSSKGHGRPPGA